MTPADFWRSMIRRYGTRFSDSYGMKPSEEWASLLASYRGEDIGRALAMLEAEAPVHPPTHPQFAAMLRRASGQGSKEERADEWLAGHWRSVVLATAERHAALVGLIPWGEKLVALPAGINREAAGELRACIAYGIAEEKRLGRRERSTDQEINSRLWRFFYDRRGMARDSA